jgi:4-amino-4-deoxy-L-arabinose transferase-like glycosyltransferase
MNLQRLLTITISVLTIIPLYSLLRKFVKAHYAVFGLALFVFEPRIIENSLLGITDAAFLFLITTSISLFLSNTNKIVYFSFVTVALSSLVRYEGLLLLIPFSILFFIKFKNKDKVIIRYFFVLGIFILTILPMLYLRIQTTGRDGLVSHIGAASNFVYNTAIPKDGSGSQSFIDFLMSATTQFIQYSSWLMIPNYIWFFPLGIILFFAKLNFEKKALILITVFFVISSAYAYGRGIQEIRYLFVFIPLITVVSVLGFERIVQKANYHKLLITVLIVGIISSSIIFLTLNPVENKKEFERYQIAQQVLVAKGTNDMTYVVKYYKSAGLIGHEFPMQRQDSLKFVPKVIDVKSFSTLTDYLNYGMNNDLTHLILDGKTSSDFLNNVFYSEEKYPYLVKQFDSADYGFSDHVKIFEIDYEQFRQQDYVN